MDVISVVRDPAVRYPAAGEHGPEEAFPERLFKDEPPGRNAVYGLLRSCLYAAGADAANYGTDSWNPLRRWVPPGSRVFVLPNFVVNMRENETQLDFQGKCSQAGVIRPILDFSIRATGDPRLVAFGNASLQSCDYDAVAIETGAAALAEFFTNRTGVALGPVDLRAVVTEWTRYGALLNKYEQHEEDVVYVDLGGDSLLDAFYDGRTTVDVRVSDYDRRDIEKFHSAGRHVYAVHRAVLDADTIISVPKLKTHEKVGITCALKGTVGSIARKECLAHHRRGGPERHGDEYPRSTIVHDLASAMSDRVTTMGSSLPANFLRVGAKVLYKALRLGPQGLMAGAWYGNDTAWRMALDIARILRFATPEGVLASTPQRQHLVIVDGIVGGEAEGPVYPRGRNDGVLIFGTDPVWVDYTCAGIMQFDPMAASLIATAASPLTYPVTTTALDEVRWVINGRSAEESDLSRVLDRGFEPPKGWRGKLDAGRF